MSNPDEFNIRQGKQIAVKSKISLLNCRFLVQTLMEDRQEGLQEVLNLLEDIIDISIGDKKNRY